MLDLDRQRAEAVGQLGAKGFDVALVLGPLATLLQARDVDTYVPGLARLISIADCGRPASA